MNSREQNIKMVRKMLDSLISGDEVKASTYLSDVLKNQARAAINGSHKIIENEDLDLELDLGDEELGDEEFDDELGDEEFDDELGDDELGDEENSDDVDLELDVDIDLDDPSDLDSLEKIVDILSSAFGFDEDGGEDDDGDGSFDDGDEEGGSDLDDDFDSILESIRTRIDERDARVLSNTGGIAGEIRLDEGVTQDISVIDVETLRIDEGAINLSIFNASTKEIGGREETITLSEMEEVTQMDHVSKLRDVNLLMDRQLIQFLSENSDVIGVLGEMLTLTENVEELGLFDILDDRIIRDIAWLANKDVSILGLAESALLSTKDYINANAKLIEESAMILDNLLECFDGVDRDGLFAAFPEILVDSLSSENSAVEILEEGDVGGLVRELYGPNAILMRSHFDNNNLMEALITTRSNEGLDAIDGEVEAIVSDVMGYFGGSK